MATTHARPIPLIISFANTLSAAELEQVLRLNAQALLGR